MANSLQSNREAAINIEFYATVTLEHRLNCLSLICFSPEAEQQKHRLPLLHKAVEPLVPYKVPELNGQIQQILSKE